MKKLYLAIRKALGKRTPIRERMERAMQVRAKAQ